MYKQDLAATAKAMVVPGKGILAADESYNTANKRFEKLGIPTAEEMRRAYREMLFTTPGIGDFFSGVILFDETIRQSTKNGTPFTKVLLDAGIILGIKLDAAFPRARTSGQTDGLLRAIVDSETGRILGCSLLCHAAGEVISTGQMVMQAKLPYTVLRDSVLTHPTMTEGLNLLFSKL